MLCAITCLPLRARMAFAWAWRGPGSVFIKGMLVGAGAGTKCVVGRFRGKWREVARQKFPIGVIISPACTMRVRCCFCYCYCCVNGV